MSGEELSPYKVWHIPQVPGRAFLVEVQTLDEARRLVDVLGDYDAFQYENRIKPDYCNASGVMAWDDEEQDYLDLEEEGAL